MTFTRGQRWNRYRSGPVRPAGPTDLNRFRSGPEKNAATCTCTGTKIWAGKIPVLDQQDRFWLKWCLCVLMPVHAGLKPIHAGLKPVCSGQRRYRYRSGKNNCCRYRYRSGKMTLPVPVQKIRMVGSTSAVPVKIKGQKLKKKRINVIFCQFDLCK